MVRSLLLSLCLIHATGWAEASTALLDENMPSETDFLRVIQLWPALDALEVNHPEVRHLRLVTEVHCDWSRHYHNWMSQTPSQSGYWQALEALLHQEGLLPETFVELSLKWMWPAVVHGQAKYQDLRERLPYWSDADQSQWAIEIDDFFRLHQLLDQCMSEAEKDLAQRLFAQVLASYPPGMTAQ